MGAAITGASPTPAQARPAPAPSTVRTVTLLTGDRVTFSADGGHVSAEPGPGRTGITFDVSTAPGSVRVVPSDTAPLLAAGRLDPRLFDVTGLVAAGYDRRDDLPLILTGGSGSPVAGLVKERDLPAVKGVAVRQPRGTAAASWRTLTGGSASPKAFRADVGRIWLDGLRRPALDVSVPRIGAPAAWEAGYTGDGVTVAVLDTGVDDAHPDLAGQVAARRNFTEEVEPDEDLTGHGTHVAATIAGTGAGKYKGVAPGAKLLDGKVCADITAARSGHAVDVPGDAYTSFSGTSMAAPHVTGAAALLAQRHPDWSGADLKAALVASAVPNPAYGVYAQGGGRLDAARAVTQRVTSRTASVSFGEQPWPHTDDVVRTHDVTYHNDGPSDVTLALGLDTVDGVFAVSPASVTVSAGGDASVTVTADTRTGPDGYLGGWLTATAGDVLVRTPYAVHREVESHGVTLRHTGRDGNAPYYVDTELINRDTGEQYAVSGPDPATATLRVPSGRYTVTSTVYTDTGEVSGGEKPTPILDTTLLAQPELTVDGPVAVDLDARLGKPITVTVPRTKAQQVFAHLAVYTQVPGGTGGRALTVIRASLKSL